MTPFLWALGVIESISGIILLIPDVVVGILIAWVLLDIGAKAWAMPDIDTIKVNEGQHRFIGVRNVQNLF